MLSLLSAKLRGTTLRGNRELLFNAFSWDCSEGLPQAHSPNDTERLVRFSSVWKFWIVCTPRVYLCLRVSALAVAHTGVRVLV